MTKCEFQRETQGRSCARCDADTLCRYRVQSRDLVPVCLLYVSLRPCRSDVEREREIETAKKEPVGPLCAGGIERVTLKLAVASVLALFFPRHPTRCSKNEWTMQFDTIIKKKKKADSVLISKMDRMNFPS